MVALGVTGADKIPLLLHIAPNWLHSNAMYLEERNGRSWEGRWLLNLGCYRPGMNSQKPQKGPITPPLLKDLLETQKANVAALVEPVIRQTPLQPSDLFQDPGAGYNSDFIDPQC